MIKYSKSTFLSPVLPSQKEQIKQYKLEQHSQQKQFQDKTSQEENQANFNPNNSFLQEDESDSVKRQKIQDIWKNLRDNISTQYQSQIRNDAFKKKISNMGQQQQEQIKYKQQFDDLKSSLSQEKKGKVEEIDFMLSKIKFNNQIQQKRNPQHTRNQTNQNLYMNIHENMQSSQNIQDKNIHSTFLQQEKQNLSKQYLKTFQQELFKKDIQRNSDIMHQRRLSKDDIPLTLSTLKTPVRQHKQFYTYNDDFQENIQQSPKQHQEVKSPYFRQKWTILQELRYEIEKMDINEIKGLPFSTKVEFQKLYEALDIKLQQLKMK